MGCSREEGLLRSFWELHCERLSARGRGALWTVFAVEGQALDADAWVYLLGPEWRFALGELVGNGFGHLVARGGGWVFERARGPEERVRGNELVRRRRVRGRDGKDACDELDQD